MRTSQKVFAALMIVGFVLAASASYLNSVAAGNLEILSWSVFGNSDNSNTVVYGGGVVLSQFTSPSDFGVTSKISVSVYPASSGGASLTALVYSSNTQQPGTLLAVGSAVSLVPSPGMPAWTDLPIVFAGSPNTNYWFGLMAADTCTFKGAVEGVTKTQAAPFTTTFSGIGGGSYSGAIAMLATYTPPASPTPTPTLAPTSTPTATPTSTPAPTPTPTLPQGYCTVATAVSPTGSGSVTGPRGMPLAAQYMAGSTVTLYASSYSGYRFDHWQETLPYSGALYQNPLSFSIDQNYAFTAVYVAAAAPTPAPTTTSPTASPTYNPFASPTPAPTQMPTSTPTLRPPSSLPPPASPPLASPTPTSNAESSGFLGLDVYFTASVAGWVMVGVGAVGLVASNKKVQKSLKL